MAKTHHIRFLIRNQANDLIVEVRKREADRLMERLQDGVGEAVRSGFFWFDTVDGRSIVINLEDVQAVRFLWDMAALPSDTVRYDGQLSIYLRGRAAPISDSTEHLEDVYDLFTNLQHGPDTVPYPSIVDEDGELIYFDAREVVMVVAPAHMLQEAGRRIASQDGLDDAAQ
jgi:hypothetical protein